MMASMDTIVKMLKIRIRETKGRNMEENRLNIIRISTMKMMNLMSRSSIRKRTYTEGTREGGMEQILKAAVANQMEEVIIHNLAQIMRKETETLISMIKQMVKT